MEGVATGAGVGTIFDLNLGGNYDKAETFSEGEFCVSHVLYALRINCFEDIFLYINFVLSPESTFMVLEKLKYSVLNFFLLVLSSFSVALQSLVICYKSML